MAPPEPQPGLVIRYAYLWRDEARQGREEGTKDRPCVMILSVRDRGGASIVTVAPVTHSPPPASGRAVEIPPPPSSASASTTCPPGSLPTISTSSSGPAPDIRPVPGRPRGSFAYGFIPAGLYQAVRLAIIGHVRAHAVQPVRRDDRKAAGSVQPRLGRRFTGPEMGSPPVGDYRRAGKLKTSSRVAG